MPNTQKVDWEKYEEVLDRELEGAGEGGSPGERYEFLVKDRSFRSYPPPPESDKIRRRTLDE